MPRSAQRPRSPLALVLLALLAEQPLHPYRMLQLIEQRGKDRVVNIAQRFSIYQAIDRLPRVFLIEDEYQRAITQAELDWLQRAGRRPARRPPELERAVAARASRPG